MQTHDRLERSFAKKSSRKLEASTEHPEPAENDAPIGDSDDETDQEDPDMAAAGESPLLGHGTDARRAAVLLCEQSLCEFTGKLVLATIAGVFVDSQQHKDRLVRNKLKLGTNYKEVLAYLEDPAREKKMKMTKRGGGGRARKAAGTEVERDSAKGKKRQSEPMVLPDDDIEDDEMERREEDGEEDLRERGLEEDGGEGDGGQGNGHEGEESAHTEGDEIEDVMGD